MRGDRARVKGNLANLARIWMSDKNQRPPAAVKKGVPLPCKPDSVPLLRGWTAISLTPPKRSALLAQSATNTRRLTGGPPFPCSVLHHARFAVPSGYPDSRWALTPPFHPCLWPCGPSAVSFCCTVCPGFSRRPSLTFMRRVALWCPDFPHLPLVRKLRPSGERPTQGGGVLTTFQSKTHPRETSRSLRSPRRS